MGRKLNWIDVLNEQARWRNRADFKVWFSEVVGRHTSLLEGSIDSFEEALTFMRMELSKLHFGQGVDLAWLDTQLRTVTLGLVHHQGAQEGENNCLPQFRVRVKGLHDSDLLRAVKDTLLVQFAEFISSCSESERCLVNRCQGLYRQGEATEEHHNNGNGNGSEVPKSPLLPLLLSSEMEERWLSELAGFRLRATCAAALVFSWPPVRRDFAQMRVDLQHFN